MPTWFEDIAGPGYAGAVMWTLVALVALGVIMLIVKIVRRVSNGGFSSTANYRTRLAVMDAAEVDAQRRLVLVRRDEVEHLIMIGGPTDIVIEQHIIGPGRSTPPAAIPSAEPASVSPDHERQVALAAQRERREPRAVPQRRVADQTPLAEPRPAPAVAAAAAPAISSPAPVVETQRTEPAIADRVAASEPTVDEAMVSEFERDFQSTDRPQRREPSIEDEMQRLLDDAPRERR